jgi:hypothetical protein
MDVMSDLRARFAARFGTYLAETIERVVEDHIKVIPGVVERGSDRFQFALVWAVGFECLSNPDFRGEHGVVPAWADLEAWIRDEAGLAAFDGTMDLGARGRGTFDGILGPHTDADVAAGMEAAEDWLLASMPIGATA